MAGGRLYVAFGSSGVKDSLANLREAPEFVFNIVGMAPRGRRSQTRFPRECRDPAEQNLDFFSSFKHPTGCGGWLRIICVSAGAKIPH